MTSLLSAKQLSFVRREQKRLQQPNYITKWYRPHNMAYLSWKLGEGAAQYLKNTLPSGTDQ